MKKRVASFVLLAVMVLLFVSMPLVSAQTYSGFNRFTDNVKLFFSTGDNKVRLALEIREKEVDSAIINAQNQEENEVTKNLEKAKEKLQVVQEKVSLITSEEVKVNVDEIKNKINKEENLPEEFDEYILEEEKTYLTAVLTEKTYEYCKELAKEDFALMLKEEECNPETAPEPLKDDLAKLKDLQERMFVQLMLEIRSCIDDPGTCNCDNNVDIEQKAKCEKMVALAVKCEYKDDESSCNELESMKPKKGDSFAESFVPDFLMNLFREKEGKMIGYDIDPSCGVPEECWDENDKPECKQYDYLKETKEDWDEYGNYIGKKRDCGTEGEIPSMQESIPQCFDENDNFLEEKCGKITIVKNEEGLINYIIENEINNIINEFENKSEQHLMEIRSGWMMVEGEWVIDKGQIGNENWTIDGGQNQVENKAWEIKQEMNQINNQIVERTYAPGTGPGGDATNNIVDNVVVSGGHEDNEPLPEPDLNQINPDLVTKDTTKNEVVEGDGGEGDYAEGTTAEGIDGGEGGITGAVMGSGNYKSSFLERILSLFKR